jgi:AAA domain
MKHDINDTLRTEGVDAVRARHDRARRYNGAGEQAPSIAPLSIGEWENRDMPEPDRLLGDWFTTTSRTLLVASTGIGKTLFGVGMGIGMSAGAGFLHWRGVRPCNVLFVDGEMSSRLLKKRIVDEVARCGLRPEGMHFLSHDDIENFQPLNTHQGQSLIESVIKRIGYVDGILFDNVMSLIEVDMKDEEAWRQTMPWVLSLTSRSIGQVWTHHTGHDETRSYGTKTREWMMDTVIHMDRIERPDTDVSFRLSFKKARERTPDTRADFADMTVALVDNAWTFSAGDTVKNKASPLGEKFLGALKSASSGNLKAIPLDRWREQCVKRGLIDPDEKAHSARTLFSKYRRELIAANMIACNETEAWII